MTGLLLILAEPGTERFATALEVAATAAALGRPVRVLLRGAAVAAFARAEVADACGTLVELGASVELCHTAIATHGLATADLPPGIGAIGLAAFLAGREDWQLLLA